VSDWVMVVQRSKRIRVCPVPHVLNNALPCSGEWRHFRQLKTWPEKDAQLYLLAFFLTVLQDVTVAVELGMLAAVLLYVRDVTGTVSVRHLYRNFASSPSFLRFLRQCNGSQVDVQVTCTAALYT
jgi:hypothetical protein